MIAFDATAKSETASDTTLTISHTCTGKNLILFVGIHVLSASDVVSTVTYNGVAMTRVNTVASASESSYLYMLLTPATGAHNLVINISGGANTIRATSASYTGARQAAQPDASDTKTTASTTSQALAVTTVADNCWMVSFCAAQNANPAASTGVTLRDSTTGRAIGDSNAAITPPGSYSMTWTAGVAGFMEVCQASFKPEQDGSFFLAL